jgi:nitroreductase
MNSFLDLIKKRQSVRSYLDRPVEREKIERCLEAARLAPSGSNSQPWYYVVVDEPKLREAVARETFGRFVSFNRFTMQAPVFVVIVSEIRNRLKRVLMKTGEAIQNKSYAQIDLGITAEHFCIQAVKEGLGTCMLGWFDEAAVKELLAVPRQKRIHLIISLGYPASNEVRAKKRKSLDQMRSYNRYRKKPG